MSKPNVRKIRRQRADGVMLSRLCQEHGLTMTELRKILGLPPVGRPKIPNYDSDRAKAIAELRAEGFSDDLIRASFGEI